MQDSVSKGFGSVVSVVAGARDRACKRCRARPRPKPAWPPATRSSPSTASGWTAWTWNSSSRCSTESRQKPVTLDVRRPGSVRTPAVRPDARGTCRRPSVERAFFVRPGVGYIRVTSFDAQTGADIRKAIEKAGRRHAQGAWCSTCATTRAVWCPLRWRRLACSSSPARRFSPCAAAPLQAAQEKVAGFGQSVRISRWPCWWTGRAPAPPRSSPAVSRTMTGRSSWASPPTAKGLVETVFPLSDGAGLALTTAFYYTPSGRSIQKPLPAASSAGRAGARDHTGVPHGFRQSRHGRRRHPARPIVVREKPLTRLQIFLDASGSLHHLRHRLRPSRTRA